MTGFGTADGRVGELRVALEARSVNHRFFAPSVKLPAGLARWEADARDVLRGCVARGHVTLTGRVERELSAVPAIRFDRDRLAQYAAAYREVADRFGTAPTVSFTDVLRLPGVVLDAASGESDDACLSSSAGRAPGEADRAAFLAIVHEAAQRLNATRAAEGERIAAVLRERLAIAADAFARIAARAPERLVAQRDRLRIAVQDLAAGVAVSEDRLAQEIAVLADRLDVSEEIDRFRSHVDAFEAALAVADEPVGKRLGFLLQEMLREANTTGSKANDTVLLRDVLLVKEELERLREQVENVE